MPQMQLPIFPQGVEHLTPELAVSCREGRVFYFNGQMPVFVHDEADRASFRMITSQFVVNGSCRQRDIVRAFGVAKLNVMRAVKLYREQGPGGFYRPRATRGVGVLTPEVIERLQTLLDEGKEVPEASRDLGLKPNTVHKAMRAGRLHRRKKRLMNELQRAAKASAA